MDKERVKLIFSEKYNQFYTPIRIDEDVGICFIKVAKNRHDKGMKKDEIIHIEKNPNYKYVVMHNSNTSSEQHFINMMNSDCNISSKLNELKCFRKNMLIDSVVAMQKLGELAKEECGNSDELKKIHNAALELYTKINHKNIINDNRSTYTNQIISEDVKRLALSKRLFIERSDDYSGKGTNRHPSTKTERLATQARYPCGFIVRNRGGIVIAGGRYELTAKNVIDFIENYIPTEKEKKYSNSYLVPMSLRKRKQLTMCYKILEMHGLHYKNEHNYFFWVLDKKGNVVVGGENGFGFQWLLKYCRKLKHKPLSKMETVVTDKKQRSNR